MRGSGNADVNDEGSREWCSATVRAGGESEWRKIGLEREGRSALDGTRDTHDDLAARSRVSSCPSQNAVKFPAARRERGGWVREITA